MKRTPQVHVLKVLSWWRYFGKWWKLQEVGPGWRKYGGIPFVRNCRTKTLVEKKDLLEAQTAGLPLLGSKCSSLAGMDRGLYRRGHSVREGERSSQRTAGPLVSVYL
jgi:hypothetical protein